MGTKQNKEFVFKQFTSNKDGRSYKQEKKILDWATLFADIHTSAYRNWNRDG